jgi:hypothetical protein
MADFEHELLLVQLWGEEDREPVGKGQLELIDAESDTHVKISLDDEARQAYKGAFDRHAEQVKKLALRNGGRYAGFSTQMPIEEAMFGSMTIVEGIY